MANHYVCTHPASHFRHTLIAARPFAGGRYALRNYVLTTHTTRGGSEERTLSGAKELCAVLENRFGVIVPDYPGFRDAVAHNLRDAGAGG